jgi:23S rRNA pseudouridine955/2504/2580 synthase
MEKIESHVKAKFLSVDEMHQGQRLDNFLFTQLKGLPKSRVYRALRKGEIRVNKKRAKPDYRLCQGDLIRIPPLRLAASPVITTPSTNLLNLVQQSIIFEDNDFVILNKLAGVAVHGGSGVSFGVIEVLRHLRPQAKFLELAHRLDRQTSGCLVIAKKSSVLRELHQLLVEKSVEKVYLLLVFGHCNFDHKIVDAPLQKNILRSGERFVAVNAEGKPSLTHFRTLKRFGRITLLEAKPKTGRTHQIRVHAAHLGYPIVGDEKYGNRELNKQIWQLGWKELFLHAAEISFYLSSRQHLVSICASLSTVWHEILNSMAKVR